MPNMWDVNTGVNTGAERGGGGTAALSRIIIIIIINNKKIIIREGAIYHS